MIHADTNSARTTIITLTLGVSLGLSLPRMPMIFHCSTFNRRWIVDWPLVRSSLRIETNWETIVNPASDDRYRDRETRCSCLYYHGICSSNAVKQLKSVMIATQPDGGLRSRRSKMIKRDAFLGCAVLTHPFDSFWMFWLESVSPTVFCCCSVAGCSWFTRWQITLCQPESLHRPNIAV